MTQLTLDLDASTWTRVKLGAVVNRLTNGYVGPTRGLYQECGVPYLLARHVKSNRLTFDGKTFVTHEFNQKNKKSILKAGDVLLVQSGHIGESAVVTPEHEGHNCHAMIVISPKEDKLDGKFLSWYFSSHTGRSAFRRIQTGITIEHLNCRDVKEIEIPLPPLEEQRRIAAILDKADAVRRKRKEAIALTEELLRSAFLEMFGNPVTNPKGWETRYFGDVGTLDRGKSKHRPRNDPSLLGGSYPLIQTGDVANCNGVIKTYTQTYSEKGLAQSKMWNAGTLCITIAANIAQTGILGFNACFPDSVVGFHAGANVVIEYIQGWLEFLQPILEDRAPQSAQKNINLQILRELELPVPPISLQKKYADFVVCLRQHVARTEGYQQDVDNLFNSLLQRAFRGEL